MKLKHLLSVAALAFSTAASALPVLQNTSFETNNVGGGYLYAGPVVAAGWNFAGSAGVSHDATAWNGTTATGDYFAFLQVTSSVSQSFASDIAYNYTFAFDSALRGGYAPGQTVQVSLDGNVLGVASPTSTAWNTYSFSASNIAAGNHTLAFTGLATYALFGDTSDFIDNIRMTATEVVQTNTNVPEPTSLALVGLALAGLGVSRRKQQAQS